MAETFEHGYALLVGVGESAYPKLSLPVTVKDAQAIYAILVDPGLCAYPDDADHIRVLNDKQATRSAILEGLSWLQAKAAADPEATMLVYYSGHGWLEEAKNRYYLLQHDIDPFDIAGSALAAEVFTDAVRQIRSDRLLVVLDCCHAAGMATAKEGEAISPLKLPSGFKAVSASESKGLMDTLKQGQGRVVFTSSRGEQQSWVLLDQSYSLYTYHLLEALQGADNQLGETEVRVSNLMHYLGEAVSVSAQRLHQAEQVPRFDMDTEDFAIALLRGGKGLPSGGWQSATEQPAVTSQVQASGERSVAIGGDVSGSTIITGNDNVVGSGNVVQRGKYNINMNQASGLHIGDTYYSEEENDIRREQSVNELQKGDLSSKGINQEQDTSIEVPVYFATDRERLSSKSIKITYGGRRNLSGQLQFGLAKVSIPIEHRMGNLERPKWWKLKFCDDLRKHIVLLSLEAFDREQFIQKLKYSMMNFIKKDLLLFIHGYNTSFEDAILRTAQIAYDLHFLGPALLYSWPSEAKFDKYVTDENNIEWTIPHLEEFLELLMIAVDARTVNAIAHSMGNRALVRAINSLNLSDVNKHAAILKHIVFAAPDVDADTFRQFAKAFRTKAERFTLYASSKDKALEVSKLVHGGYPRAGDSGKELVIVDGVDTIDASQVDTSLIGHSYIGDNRSILSDIFYLLRHDFHPDQRSSLISQSMGDFIYWLFHA